MTACCCRSREAPAACTASCTPCSDAHPEAAALASYYDVTECQRPWWTWLPPAGPSLAVADSERPTRQDAGGATPDDEAALRLVTMSGGLDPALQARAALRPLQGPATAVRLQGAGRAASVSLLHLRPDPREAGQLCQVQAGLVPRQVSALFRISTCPACWCPQDCAWHLRWPSEEVLVQVRSLHSW